MAPTASLFPEGEPEVYGEIQGEVLGRPFRRFELQVYGARRFGAVAYRFTGVLYAVELPRPLPPAPPGPQGLAHLPQRALALPPGPPGAFWGPPRPAPCGPPGPEARDEPPPPPGLPRPLPP